MNKVLIEFETPEDANRYFKNISINIKGIKEVSRNPKLFREIEELKEQLNKAEEVIKKTATRKCGMFVDTAVDEYLYGPRVSVIRENR